jgi:outer membrane biosynthesis protein TonB
MENLRAGKERAAIVKFIVNADGSTTIVESKSDEDKYFAGHAALAFRDWRFRPATKGGTPVATRCKLKRTFNKSHS